MGGGGIGCSRGLCLFRLLAWRMKTMSGETVKHTATNDRIGDRSHPTLTIGTTVSETVSIVLFLFPCSFYRKA